MPEFTRPQIFEVSGQIGDLSALRRDSEQQQQQQQQQQGTIRRFLNLETNLPEEEIVQSLSLNATATGVGWPERL